ncbi:TonB family C-terminal domain-containing protein [Sphingomonas laterariae]|uniref:TonB family C-terminal domain-containing protein n=1 Tax=Edaphosphingomonas laterariae TaxID=861865 RepID=A0A239HPG7_9SPHN|nr:energy transducer TonB [Sphingomonas laterariae]SNS82988.1 TonB family C-terminal domain-containing protein [Sphingomonas laterariae]
MLKFDTIDFQRIAVSSAGALLLSAACVMGAVGPARAAEANAPLTISDWALDVSQQIDAELRAPSTFRGDAATARVQISFDAAGAFTGASVARSSGNGSIDREAVRVANAIAYPAFPEGLRGQAQTVNMEVHFGTAANPHYAARERQLAERLAAAPRKAKDVETAALPIG